MSFNHLKEHDKTNIIFNFQLDNVHKVKNLYKCKYVQANQILNSVSMPLTTYRLWGVYH